MKYEVLIENYHGHCFRYRFDANSDAEARKIAVENGFKYYDSDDCLWRVEGNYVNHSHFDETEQFKMEQNYIPIM